MKKKQIGITDIKTGEIIREINENEIVSISSKEKKFNYQQQKKTFLKIYKIFIKDIVFFNLSKSQYNTLFLLLDLVPYGSQIIQIDGVPANRKMLVSKLKLDYQLLGRHINKFSKLNIIKKDGTGKQSHFYVNPFFVSFGNKISDRAIELFYNEK